MRRAWVAMRVGVTGVLVALFTLPLSIAHAEKQPRPAHSTDAPVSIPLPGDTIRRLRSADPATVRAALDDVRVSGKSGSSAVATIVELLRKGLPPPLTRAALAALADTESEAASETLAWYARNRNADIRRDAVEALAKTRGAAAMTALRAGLSDADSGVRSRSAIGLGTIKAKQAVPDLLTALEHNVLEAAAPIGELCVADQCDRLASKLGRMPFGAVTAGLHQLLLRPSREVPDDVKKSVIDRVRELATPEANQFLQGVQSKWPVTGSREVKHAIDQAVTATRGASGSSQDDPSR